jgi:hypothetical protein
LGPRADCQTEGNQQHDRESGFSFHLLFPFILVPVFQNLVSFIRAANWK